MLMVAIAVFAALAPGLGCGASAGPKVVPVSGGAGCDPERLEACEATIAAAIERGDDATPAVRAYVAARSQKGDDALAGLLSSMEKAAPHAVVVEVGGTKITSGSVTPIELAELPKLASISEPVLLLALARAANVGFAMLATSDGTIVRAYAKDPIAPLMAGVLPIAKTSGPADLDAEAGVEAAMERASDAGKRFDYVEASDAVDELDAYVKAHDPFELATLRARVLSNAMALSAPISWSAPDGPKKPSEGPPPSAGETPYVDMLRVRLDDRNVEWAARGARLLSALPEAKRPAIRQLYDPHPACAWDLPPTISREGDLVMSGLVTRALLPSHTHDARGRVPLETWYPAYAAMVDTIDRTDTTFLYAARLVIERGESAGIVPVGSETHRLVNRLALKHTKALEKLAEAKPGRLGLSNLGFLVAPGNMVDPDLRKETLSLAQLSARGGLEEAKDAPDALLALLTAGLTGLQLPGELREAHFGALQSVFTAKLRGDFSKKTGWGVATLFALDGLYRVLFDQAPNLSATSAEVVRALETDPSIPEPEVATLVAAMTRYVALAADGQLGAEVPKPGDAKPEREAARRSLEKALAALGGPDAGGSTDPFVRDVAELADGTIATVAELALVSQKTKKTAGCSTDALPPLDPRAKNALAHLRDTRRTIFASAGYKAPKTERDKRMKLFVLLLSDVMDAIEANGSHDYKFAIAADDARGIIGDALRGWLTTAGIADALTGGYMLTRGFFEHGTSWFTGAGSGDIRTLLAGLGTFFKGGGGDTIEGAVLLTMLLPSKPGGTAADFMTALVDVARTLFDAKKPEQANMVLLGSVVLSSLRELAPSDDASALARDHKSDVAWVLSFMRTVGALHHGKPGDPASYESELDTALVAQCGSASTKDIAAVLGAVDAFRSGKRKEARAALEAVLADAKKNGFSAPHYSFSFKQETRSRALSLTLDIGLAQGLVSNTNAFNLGAGAKSDSDPVLKLEQSVASPDAKATLDESARYIVHAAALVAVYDFLDGDAEAGEIAAARAIGLVTQHGWLDVAGVTDEPMAWAKDSRAAFLVLAELAADSGRPLLAGDLFAVVKATFDAGDDADAIARSLDEPFGLVGLDDAAPILERAKKTAPRLAAALPCFAKKKRPVPQDRATCAEYPEALALRVADAVSVMPALGTGPKGQSAACPDLAALDAFLKPAAQRVYDPDKFLAAVDGLVASGKRYDATVLLTKHRREDHCSAAVTDRLTSVADGMKNAPVARADLLSAYVNCSLGATPPNLAKAIGDLDDALADVGDPSRLASVALFAAGASIKLGSWEPLEAIALKPGFIESWEHGYPAGIGAALVLDHAATILHGDPVRIEATAPQFDLVCGGNPPSDRAVLCKTITKLRQRGTSDDDLKKAAKDALTSIVMPGG